MNKTILFAALFAVSTGVYAVQPNGGGESNNTGCNGVGNRNSPCAGDNSTVVAPTVNNKLVNNPITVQANTQANTQTNEQWLYLGYSNADYSVQNSYSQSAASATGGTATASGGQANSTNTLGASASGGTVSASGNATNSGNNTGTSTVVVQGDAAQARDPVASAVAPTVITGSDQCLVPVALGGQAVGFGISFGVAVRDENCEVLKLSRQIEYLVDKQAAIHFLRMHDKRVDEALKALGK